MDLVSEYEFGAWIRCIDPVHRYGHCKEKQDTLYREECINTAVCTAITLQSIHFFQSLLQKHCILFSPTHPCLYVFLATFSLQVYIE